jgi:hypothetical protein
MSVAPACVPNSQHTYNQCDAGARRCDDSGFGIWHGIILQSNKTNKQQQFMIHFVNYRSRIKLRSTVTEWLEC